MAIKKEVEHLRTIGQKRQKPESIQGKVKKVKETKLKG